MLSLRFYLYFSSSSNVFPFSFFFYLYVFRVFLFVCFYFKKQRMELGIPEKSCSPSMSCILMSTPKDGGCAHLLESLWIGDINPAFPQRHGEFSWFLIGRFLTLIWTGLLNPILASLGFLHQLQFLINPNFFKSLSTDFNLYITQPANRVFLTFHRHLISVSS